MEQDIKGYSPLVLAYMGDAIYELYVRDMLVKSGSAKVNQLHKRATGYVSADAQFRAYHIVEERLTEDELAVFKRGRNAKSYTVPKNAEVSHYRTATGMEALFGYLYLTGQTARAEEIMQMIFEQMENQ